MAATAVSGLPGSAPPAPLGWACDALRRDAGEDEEPSDAISRLGMTVLMIMTDSLAAGGSCPFDGWLPRTSLKPTLQG